MRTYTTLVCISKNEDTKVTTRYEHDVDLSTVCGYYPAFGETDAADSTNVDFDSGDGISVDMPITEFRKLMKSQPTFFHMVWRNG